MFLRGVFNKTLFLTELCLHFRIVTSWSTVTLKLPVKGWRGSTKFLNLLTWSICLTISTIVLHSRRTQLEEIKAMKCTDTKQNKKLTLLENSCMYYQLIMIVPKLKIKNYIALEGGGATVDYSEQCCAISNIAMVLIREKIYKYTFIANLVEVFVGVS